MVWCDYCAKSTQTANCGSNVCCTLCGKVLYEDYCIAEPTFVRNITLQSMKIGHETEEIYEEAVEDMSRMHIAEEIPANPKKSVVDAHDNILVQSRKVGHEIEEIYEEAVDNMTRMHIVEITLVGRKER